MICEPVDNTALWITDIIDSVVHESIKKGLNVVAMADGQINDRLWRAQKGESKRRLVLVIGYTLAWINNTLGTLCELGAEPILVSVYQHRFKSEYSYVSFNTVEAMRMLVGYIVGTGRDRIALFGLHHDTIGDMSKLCGFILGMRDAGAAYSGDDIYRRGLVDDCAKRLCENISRYQAVMCTSDLLAVYLISYLKRHKIRVPDDIYVTGFGNWSSVEHYDPSITRMYTDLTELGAQAVKHYIYMQNNPKNLHGALVISCTLQVGRSTECMPVKKLRHDTTLASKITGISPTYNSDPDIMKVLKLELLVRNMDNIDISMLREISLNRTYAQIVDIINISESTIKYRLTKLLRTCGFANRSELIEFAVEFGLL